MTNFLFVSWPSGYYFRMLFKDLKKLTMILMGEHVLWGTYQADSMIFPLAPLAVSPARSVTFPLEI